MEQDKNKAKLCPSYMAKVGAHLFGILGSGGKINYLNNPIEVNEEFIVDASRIGPPEERFRFTGSCAKSGCNQWDDKERNCGLINKIINIVNNQENEILQFCPIRTECRWYSQKKGLACAQCNEVIRNVEINFIENEQLKKLI